MRVNRELIIIEILVIAIEARGVRTRVMHLVVIARRNDPCMTHVWNKLHELKSMRCWAGGGKAPDVWKMVSCSA